MSRIPQMGFSWRLLQTQGCVSGYHGVRKAENVALPQRRWAPALGALGGHTWHVTDLSSMPCRLLLALGETQAGEALPHLSPAEQLVLHLAEAHLPVPGGPGEPLFR